MKVFLAGSTGATGSLLLRQLLDSGHQVVTVARSKDRIPDDLRAHTNLKTIQASLLEMSDTDLKDCLTGCEAIGVCLGHNLSFKGVYGKPRKLVRDAVIKLCTNADQNLTTRFVLMNTSGNRNKKRNEKVNFGHKLVVGLLRLILPPHTDNEQAAEYLQYTIGAEHPNIDWAIVRPDGLVDKNEVSAYDVHYSPTRDPIFNAGKTSRINVAHFMADLLKGEDSWQKWKGELPVIYNREA